MGRTREALLRGQGPRLNRPREMEIYTEVREEKPVNERVYSSKTV